MRGVFLVQLHKYVSEKYGEEHWKEYLRKINVSEKKLYFSNNQYDEEEFKKLIKEIMIKTGQTREMFLESFGNFMSLFFLASYKTFIKSDWKTLDVLEHIEEYNHHILQAGGSDELAGKFKCKRIDPKNLEIIYSSPRKMCSSVIGLIKGLSAHFKEHVLIKQSSCVMTGDPECLFHVSLIGNPIETTSSFTPGKSEEAR